MGFSSTPSVQHKLIVSESVYTLMVTLVAPKQRQEYMYRHRVIREEMGKGEGRLSNYTSSSVSPTESPSDTYVGGWVCLRSPKITTHSSCGNAGKVSKWALRCPASMVLNSVPRRGLQTARSWSAYPAPVGGDHHAYSCTAAHVFASGAARMPRGTSANVE